MPMRTLSDRPNSTDSVTNPILFVLALVGLVGAASAWSAEPPNLRERLQQLNVRSATPHYNIAGTVQDARLREYAAALELIYAEYDRGFARLFEEPAKADDQPAKKAGRRKSGAPAAASDDEEPSRGEERGAREEKSSSSTKRTTANRRERANQPDSDDGATAAGAGKSAGSKSRKSVPEKSAAGAKRGGAATLADEDKRFPVIIFGNENEYLEFTRTFNLGNLEHTSGAFFPSIGLLLIADQANFEKTCDVLFHEAFHQFLHRYIKNPPMWLNEGLATHFECARVHRGRLEYGRPRGDYWKLIRKALEKDLALPLATVVAASREQFYDPRPVPISGFEDVRRKNLYYGQAYTLVHLLMNDASALKRLQDYMRALAASDGLNNREITEKFFDAPTCDKLAPHWRKHIQSRPENR